MKLAPWVKGKQNICLGLFPTFKHKCSGAWNHVNGSCIWVRGGGGLADPLSDQIWALHLHIARPTPDYLCNALLAHIAQDGEHIAHNTILDLSYTQRPTICIGCMHSFHIAHICTLYLAYMACTMRIEYCTLHNTFEIAHSSQQM